MIRAWLDLSTVGIFAIADGTVFRHGVLLASLTFRRR